MPPRVTKKTAAGPGSKRAIRGRAVAKAQAKVEEDPEVMEGVKAEEEKPAVAMEEKDAKLEEAKKKVAEDMETKLDEENEDEFATKGTDAKVSIDEYEKDERLDLGDNDPEYENEEYGGVDYDEKEIETDPQEYGGEEEEDPEEEVYVGEEEGDLIKEEIEGVPEELEPEEDDERVEEEHEHPRMMSDAAEEEEHHEVVKERRKRKEFEIFVGGLDKDASESDLRNVFSEVGEVTESLHVLDNPPFQVHGKQCGVTPSQDSDTLFIGNICKTWTKEALIEKLKHYGVEDFEDLTLVEESDSSGLNRGFAFLEFSTRSEAMDAFKRLQKRGVVFGVDRPAKISFADSFIDPGDEIMAQVKTVFIDGISASWDEEHVKELLKKYGEIEKIELARNMTSARRKDFGFVTFNSHDAAVVCAKSINNEELSEGDIKAKVRARLSRPLQRGKGKSVSRRDSRPGRGSIRGARSPWGRPAQRSVPVRGPRGIGPRIPPVSDRGFRRPAAIRDRRPVMAPPPRARPVAPLPRSRPVAPLPRSYDRRPPVPSYSKSGMKRDYGHREGLHPRSRAAPVDYNNRAPLDRRMAYRDDYSPPRAPTYPDYPRGDASRSTARRSYVDDGYSQRYERPPAIYRDTRGREYDSLSGSKRPYAAMDDAPPRYAEPVMRHSRARLDYDPGSGASHYGDTYSDRLGRSNIGSGSRRSISSQESHGFYNGRQGMGYDGGPYGGSDVSGMYSSSSGGGYMPRGSNSMVALIHLSTLDAVWVVVVIWEAVVRGHIIERSGFEKKLL
ncbi:hypothetical protein CASFOL_041728 [Castilleja foliolosa]|uniref:RRM domain-containing protein n=1 Tax=Castilleja foliolosa TaxID=1961234 RepID=A0ABD3B936_9LAMI